MNKEDEILKQVNEISKTLNEHTKILNKHSRKLEEHDAMFKKIIETLESMHKSILLIEDDVHNKIPALFDAHDFHQDHLEKNDKEIENLQSITENHSLRIISLEQDSKEHSKQLKSLSTAN